MNWCKLAPPHIAAAEAGGLIVQPAHLVDALRAIEESLDTRPAIPGRVLWPQVGIGSHLRAGEAICFWFGLDIPERGGGPGISPGYGYVSSCDPQPEEERR